MRGIVLDRINLRERADVNSRVLDIYEKNTIVEVVATKPGVDLDQEDLWYQLKNGGFLWSSGVRIHMEDFDLPEKEREQFMICYRQTKDGVIREDLKSVPAKLSFAKLSLPSHIENIRAEEWSVKGFVNNVMSSVHEVDPQVKRKHVFIYIPGYQLQLLNSLRTDLLSSFTLSYMTHPQNSIAKVLFFSWPSQSGPKRETVDDRSVAAGESFTANGMFDYLEKLSIELKKENRCLNLVAHSFGHQLLNGMINPKSGTVPQKIFENVFLMAPDISYLSVQINGALIKNTIKNPGSSDTILYDLSKLNTLANNIHVFHDKYDFLLYSSTVRFAGDKDLRDLSETGQYRNLGNHGNMLKQQPIHDNFHFIDVENEVKNNPAGDLWDYPFRALKARFERDINDMQDPTN
ncbi:MAG: alpha/beta hydrolase, partial [Chryseolinea sp.]